MLAVQCDLISEYFAFKKGRNSEYDDTSISKLFKYLHPFKMSVLQKNHIGLSDEEVGALGAGNFIKIRNFTDENDLIQNTTLKVMLSKDSDDGSFPYPYINILDDETDVNFTATYKSGDSRAKAKEHIKALLADASQISIYDRYLSKINRRDDSWNTTNKQLLLDILPKKTISIKLYCEYNWSTIRKSDLTAFCSDWTILKQSWSNNIHDRYIETDKVIILLSSGIINLDDLSTKDFTYIVKVKS